MKADVHESAREHVTGAAHFTDDLVATRRDVLHAFPVQATHAHARLVAIDASRALSMPGVVHVLRASDVPGDNDLGSVRRDEPLFPSEICYHGQPVAWVLAESFAEARLAAAAVSLVVEPLAAILSMEAAIAANSFLTGPRRLSDGDAEAGLEAAELRLAGELHVGGQEHFYLETQAAFAERDASGELFVRSSTQHPTEVQHIVARVLGIASHRVTCESLRMGGGFGGKETQANLCAAVAALGCVCTGRPVSVRLDRKRDITITGKRHAFLARFRAGFQRDGRVTALSVELFSDGGYCLDLSEAILWRALFHIDNAYRIEHLSVVGRVARTHLPSNTAMRGFGGPQAMVVIEDVMDRVARTLGLLPDVVRAKNFYREGQHTHYGQPVRGAERLSRIFGELRAESAFVARSAAVRAFNQAHAQQKRGLAITPVKFGISFTATFFNQAGALVLVYRDGSVQVNHAGTEMGQGLHTKLRAIAARTLGLRLDAVRMMPTRTDKIPNTSATAASSGSDLNGAAVREACEMLRARLAPFAAELLSVPPDEVLFADSEVWGGGRRVLFAEVCERAYLARVPLFAAGFYKTPGIHFDPTRGKGEPFHYFAYGAAVSEVEVDGFTGQYALRRVDILHDVGESLAPAIDLGQIEGGFVQGLGYLTSEVVSHGPDGALRTSSASTYKVPTIGECPPIFNVRLLERAEEPSVVYGSKAVGEPPFMLAISVREALRDAIAAFGSQGPVELGCPATPEAVFWAIQARRRKGQTGSGQTL